MPIDIIPPKQSGPPRTGSGSRIPAPGNVSPAGTAYGPQPAPPSKPGRPERHLRSIFSTVALFVSAFLIAFLLNAFVIQSYQVDGESMQPTLMNDDRLIVDKIPRTMSRISGHQYVPHRGDIVIFNETGLPGFLGSKQLIKRVIGLPGERVVVNNGKITIYNQAHPNGFNPDTSSGYHIAAPTTIGSVDLTLKSSQLFVCGDNRGNSEDSRYFGPIQTNQLVAKLVLRIMPLGQVKSF